MATSDIYQEAENRTREIALDDYRAYIAEGAERTRFQVDYSQSTLRNLQLVNGGAIVALLTFLGNNDVAFNFRGIWWAFVWFGCGLFSSLAAYLGAFFSQHFYMQVTYLQAWNAQLRARGLQEKYEIQSDHKRGNVALACGVSLAVLSLVFFIIGAFVALLALK